MYRRLFYSVCVLLMSLACTSYGMENLVAYYAFEGDVMDDSGNGLHGTIIGDIIYSAGAVGSALDLDGNGNYVDCGNDPKFNILGEVTVAVWVNIRSLPQAWSAVFTKGDSSWRISSNNLTQGMHFAFEDGSRGWQAANSATLLNLGEWYHVAGTYDTRVGAKIYINGVVDGSNSDVLGLTLSTYNVYIGENAQAVNRFWDGLIDEIYLFDRSFEAEEIQALMVAVDTSKAWKPRPPDGRIEVARDAALGWTAGDLAEKHNVYLGSNPDDVDQATVDDPRGILVSQEQAENTYDPEGLLDYGLTYYWRIDEVSSAYADSPRKGDVWSFEVLNYPIVVDDFEDYNDYEPDTIYLVWIDGYGDPMNGSTSGYPDPDFVVGEHFVETNIIHSGHQSMPLFYDNSAGLSEATKTINANWTEGGVVTLTLFYYGDPANALVPMYVALNGNAVVTNDVANAVQLEGWNQWDIPLQAFADQGVDLANIRTLSIGFGNKANPVAGGSGLVFFDDIRLYLPEQ